MTIHLWLSFKTKMLPRNNCFWVLLFSPFFLSNLVCSYETTGASLFDTEFKTCENSWKCYGVNWCTKLEQNRIRPDHLSRQTCFKQKVNFTMGTSEPVFKMDGEGPARYVELDSFCIDQTEVSNLQFFLFVKETGYITEAERFGNSMGFVGSLSQNVAKSISKGSAYAHWWVLVDNASWFQPEGVDSNIYQRPHHPVTHVSWNDANAYCAYFNKRLPTEAEWEYACRGGLKHKLYPWGNLESPNNKHYMNIWQGRFPNENFAEDGYIGLAPVDEFNQNKFNVKNMVGNVWEWVSDWWTIDHSKYSKHNPRGPEQGRDKVKKGGSFMCTKVFCHRYRCAARTQNTPDTSTSHGGFRCASNFK